MNEALYNIPHEAQDKVTVEVDPRTGVTVNWSRAFSIRLTMDDTGDGVTVSSPWGSEDVPFGAAADAIQRLAARGWER